MSSLKKVISKTSCKFLFYETRIFYIFDSPIEEDLQLKGYYAATSQIYISTSHNSTVLEPYQKSLPHYNNKLHNVQ